MPEFWRIALSILLMLAFSGALAWYLVVRASAAFALSRRQRYVMAALFASGLLALTLSRSLDFELEALAKLLGTYGSAVTLAVVISSVLMLPIELARFVTRRRKDLEQPARRAFLTQAATGGAIAWGSGAALYGTLFGSRDYTLETVPLVLAKLPRTLDGFTIVQLSDIHIGTFIGERELAAALSLVRDAKPDLIVLTGDLLDHDPAYAPKLARFTRSLTSLARHGVHAIPGNHDYYAGVDATLRALDEGGAEVLLNRHVTIADGFVLGGVDDVRAPMYGGPGPKPAQAFRGADPERARVLLSHNPADFEQSHTFADLVLSGHTHGGQITMFVNPARLILTHGLVRGHYLKDGTQLYVNRGFGTAGPPARIGSPPEVTKLVLSSRA
ncbi:MAG TPA: metallophosphoesterase [Polyangiales bacterium]|nr:metallophosphoesterase [Polyangiales bacterium]